MCQASGQVGVDEGEGPAIALSCQSEGRNANRIGVGAWKTILITIPGCGLMCLRSTWGMGIEHACFKLK